VPALIRELGAAHLEGVPRRSPHVHEVWGKLEIIAYLHDQVAISKILDHLGLSPPETTKPPPAVHEVARVPVDEEGREMAEPQTLNLEVRR
jgi:hypothetical protein